MTANPTVQGRCPACRGTSLFLGDGGHVTCARLDCPNPTAADDLLHQEPAPTPAWTPPPPGSTREQLPAHILAALAGLLPDYTSTACHTADALAVAATYRHPLYDELRQHAERLHERCRLNHKFTGQLCVCGCHTAKEPNR